MSPITLTGPMSGIGPTTRIVPITRIIPIGPMSGAGRTVPIARPTSLARASPSGVSRPVATTGPRSSGRATLVGGTVARPRRPAVVAVVAAAAAGGGGGAGAGGIMAAGGTDVSVGEGLGRRAGFVAGWAGGLAIYPAAIAGIAVVAGEYTGRLLGLEPAHTRWVGAGMAALFTAINLAGVASGRWVQNLVTGAKVLALTAVVGLAFTLGGGSGWASTPPLAPTGTPTPVALALASQAVIWTYYGYLDVAKIAEEVVDPGRTLPRILLGGIGIAAALYLLLNASFFQVLPIDRIAASNLAPGDVAAELTGARGGSLVAALAVALFVGTAVGRRGLVAKAGALLVGAYALSWTVKTGRVVRFLSDPWG